MSNLVIFDANDAFTRFEAEAHNHNVHIRVQSRRGRKCTTTVEGLSGDLDLKSITRSLKRKFLCSGTVLDDPTFGKVIKITGDQRVNIFQFLVSESICTSGQVTIH
jgi:translation initiation factor 1